MIARKAATTVGVVLVALVALLAFAGGEDEVNGVSALLQQRTPEVAGTAIDGTEYNIDDHRGSWVLVNFFATWCPGCINEHPDLVELEQWGEQNGNLSLVSVVFNDPLERVEEFFADEGGTWPVLNNPEVPIDFGVAQIPETFLVSPAGQVVWHQEGEVRADRVIELINLAEGGE